MKLGLAGLGEFNKSVHAPAIKKYCREEGGIELVLCDLDSAKIRKWQKRFGVFPSFTDTAQMIKEAGLDAAYITVRPDQCCRVTCSFLKAGIPVFTEKPPGLNIREIKQLIKYSKGIPNAVGFNRRFSPFIIKMKELLDKDIGKKAIFTGCVFYRSARYDGNFHQTLIHGIDTLRHISGDFTEFDVKTHFVKGKKPFYNYCIAGRQTESGLTRMTVLPVSGMDMERYTVTGEDISIEASVVTGTEKGKVIVFKNGKPCKIYTAADLGIDGAPVFVQCGFYNQAKRFIDGIRYGRNPGTSFSECFQTVELTDKVRRKQKI